MKRSLIPVSCSPLLDSVRRTTLSILTIHRRLHQATLLSPPGPSTWIANRPSISRDGFSPFKFHCHSTMVGHSRTSIEQARSCRPNHSTANLTMAFSCGARSHSTFASPFNNTHSLPSPLQALVRLRTLTLRPLAETPFHPDNELLP
jgi:hypothetical protein